MTEREGDLNALLRRLAGRRALARAVILFERLWPALWPPLGVLGLFVCAALLEVPRALPSLGHITLLAATAIAFVVLLVRGLRSVRAPDDTAADRRLEQASGLQHRPLSVLTDRPAQRDPAGLALWQAHFTRAIAQVRRLRVGAPHPGLARRDRLALRGALIVALVATFGIAGRDAPTRLAYALEPTLPRPAALPGTELQAWITPPAYTHMAPIFLHPAGGAVTAPAGSHLTVSVTGGSGTPGLLLDKAKTDFRALDQGSFQADADLTTGGHLSVRRDGDELAGWDLSVVADQPPTAEWTEKPGGATQSQETRLPWQTGDDYGVVSLHAELRLQARPDTPPVVVSIPLPGGETRAAHGVNQEDLTANPWAGLPVIARLVARDAPGQRGFSADATFVLPERMFRDPAAQALIAIRKGLSLHPDDRDDAVDGLDALLMQPKLFRNDIGAYVNLGALYYLLEYNKSAAAIPQAQQQMWQLALHMEEGQTEQTARALEKARQAAQDALDKAIRSPTDANRAELEKRLQELEQAIQNHIQALVEQAQRDHQTLPFNPQAQHLTAQDFKRLAEEARHAARDDRMNDAQRRMSELERMLDQLRNARANQGKAAQQRQQQRQRGHRQMGALQDMIRRQGGLLDHAQGRADEENEPHLGPAPTQPADPAVQRQADQRVQQALRRALGELMQEFSDLTGKLPPGLGKADTDMRSAGQQLAQGNDQSAGEAEQKAIEDLQKGGQQMGQAMAQQFGPGQNGQGDEADSGDGDGEMGLSMQEGEGDQGGEGPLDGSAGRGDGQRDPLGRRYTSGTTGADEGSDVALPEKRDAQRTRTIEDELRRRDAERDRPQMELDYIGRLLKQF
ncbi:MAG TPA: DUF4175 family protein [Acetobacteraceae bacterium]|jgi:uncharacterized protein (TIGR02302 family)